MSALAWTVTPGLLVGTAALVLNTPGDEPPLFTRSDVPYLVATLSCWLVGVVLTRRVPEHRAGWAFLGLGTALAWSAVTDVYAQNALSPSSDAPAGALAATFSDTSFVWWFVFLALILHFTAPPTRPERLSSALPTAVLGIGAVFQLAALLRSTHLDPPHDDLVSPWAVKPLAGVLVWTSAVAMILLGLCLIGSAVALVVRWQRAVGQVRQQLLWLVAGALPLPVCVLASFAVSYADHPDIAGYLMSGAIAAIAAGAALSVLRYRLYDVERILTDSAAYAIASAAVLLTFGVVVVVISRTTPIDPASQLTTVLATLAGAATARTSYVWARKAVDRRLNPQRFDAVQSVRAGLASGSADLDSLLADALRDPRARVVYPVDDRWITSDGREVAPARNAVDVRRGEAVTARIEFDAGRNERAVIEALATETAAEIDNVALRAELARQLDLINESRSRLATAQLEERRRIERDLHDGAQQRLLALALQLQSAQVNGGADVLRDEVRRAVAELGITVQELRDLAAGLQPAALAGGGLLAAVVDLALRIPLNIRYDVIDRRFDPSVEGAAWFVIAEATTNAVKHAAVSDVSISAQVDGSALRIVVKDDGIGGADANGRGLQGLADRVAALRGQLCVTENVPHGTVVEAVLPCAS